MVFIDDILVYSASWKEHMKHVRMVFEKLKEHQFYLKKSMCVFGRTQLTFLRHVISQRGVSTDPAKTLAMERWPIHTSISELRGFFGLTGYYRIFVKGYGVIAKPMMSTPVLALPNFEESFVVETDACDDDIGAVLMQK